MNKRRHFNVQFRHNFDGWKIDATSTCFFWWVFKRQKIVWCQILISFRYFRNGSRLVVSFRCKLISMYFLKIISFWLYSVITLNSYTSRYSDRICLQPQWFLVDILWKFPGNGQRRRPFSVSCRSMKRSVRVFPFQ